MKIKMLRSSLGSNDGHTVKLYEADEEYDVSDDLGNSFIGEKIAELAKEGNKEEPLPDTFVDGEVYRKDGEIFVGAMPAGATEVALLPVDQLTEEQVDELATAGKLTKKEVKAITKAIQNKAIVGAPENKSAA